ncbi:MAG: 3'-5' exonuclease [Betaproteobacteria bacterium]|nr:3'-5' exonuclease [Betaproteobacteria bacterium]
MGLRIIGLDTETTGLKQELGHRIIEIAMLTYDSDSRKLVDRWVQRIDPERPIDPAAQEVHGIAYTDLVGCPKWDEVAPEIVRRMGEADLLVAHNMGFDGPFVAAELIRVGLRVPNTPSVCTMESARWACPDGKLPRLGELCFALGVRYDAAKAHSAIYDVDIMMECLFRGLKRGFYRLPEVECNASSFRNCHDAELKAA